MTELVDRLEITDLVTRLGRWLDAKDYRGGRAVYDEDEGRRIYAEDAVMRTSRGSADGFGERHRLAAARTAAGWRFTSAEVALVWRRDLDLVR